jgi:hypothetical protein
VQKHYRLAFANKRPEGYGQFAAKIRSPHLEISLFLSYQTVGTSDPAGAMCPAAL